MGNINGPLWGQSCLSAHAEFIEIEKFFSVVTPMELFEARHHGISVTPAFLRMLRCVSNWIKPAIPLKLVRRPLVGFADDRRILRELPAEYYSLDPNTLGWVLGEMVLEQKHAIGACLKQVWHGEQETGNVFYTPAYAVEVRHRDDCNVFVLDAHDRRLDPSCPRATGTSIFYPDLAG